MKMSNIHQTKISNMKISRTTIRSTIITSLIIIGSQASLLAENHGPATAPSGMNPGKVISGFILLLLLLLAPLLKINDKRIPVTKQ